MLKSWQMGFYISPHFSVFIGKCKWKSSDASLHRSHLWTNFTGKTTAAVHPALNWLNIYPVCLGGCYWLASFVCDNRIFLEKETKERSGDGGKEEKGKKTIIWNCYTGPVGYLSWCLCFDLTFWYHESVWVFGVINCWLPQGINSIFLIWTHPKHQ